MKITNTIAIRNKDKKFLLVNLTDIFLWFVFTGVFFNSIEFVVRGLIQKEVLQGLLIIALSVFMIWSRRNKFTYAQRKPCLVCGIPVTIFGAMLLVLSNISSVVVLQEIAFILSILGLVLLLYGTDYFTMMVIPVLYICLSFSIFREILEFYSYPLQLLTASLSSNVMFFFGIPVHQNKILIEMPYAALRVERLCSGWNYIVSLITLSIPVLYISEINLVKKFAIALFMILVGIVLNVIRVVSIGVWIKTNPDAPTHGIFHTTFTLLTYFIVVTAIFFYIGKKKQNEKSLSSIKHDRGIENHKRFDIKSWSAALGILCCTAFLLIFYRYLITPVKFDMNVIPYKIGEWTGKNLPSKKGAFENLPDADVEIVRRYSDGNGNSLDLYIGYYPKQTQHREVVGGSYKWLQEESEVLNFDAKENSERRIRTITDIFRGYKYYYWYSINGKNVSDNIMAKLLTTLDGLLRLRTNGAIAIVSTEATRNHVEILEEVRSFINALIRILEKQTN